MTDINSNYDFPSANGKEMDYFMTPTPLFKSIESQNLEKILHILQTKPEQASIWIVRRSNTSLPAASRSSSSSSISSRTSQNIDYSNINRNNNRKEHNIVWKRLPIHEACIRNPCVTLMEALIHTYPTGMRLSDAAGRLPIHHACIHGVNEQVILKMILAHPESMIVKDKWGKTPLKVLEASTHKEKNRIVALLAKGPGYYFRRVVEDEMLVKKEKDQQKAKEEFQTFKKRYEKKLSIMENSLYEEREKFHEKEANHMKEIIDLVAERDEMKAQRDRIGRERDAFVDKSKKWRGTVDDSASALMNLRTEMNNAHIEHTKTVQQMNKNLMNSNKKMQKDAQEIYRLNDLVQRTKKTLHEHKNLLKQNEKAKKELKHSLAILREKEQPHDQIQQENRPLESSTSSFTESMCVRVARLTSENKSLRERNKDLQQKLMQVDNLSQFLLTLSGSFQSLDLHKDSLIRLAEEQRAELKEIESLYANSSARMGKSKSSYVSKIEKDLTALRTEFSLPRL